MAKIDRYDGNLKAFASAATGTERTVFGDTSQSDTLNANVVADFFRGWGITGPSFNPTKQDFNGLAFTLGQLIAYLHQQGIPEWNTSQEYYRGSVVTTLAGIYRLKNGGDATVDPDNDNGTNWELAPTRAEVDAKANQATTYTETEVDNLLDDKADQANTYTETEVDELTGSLAYPNTTLASSSDISENLIEPITAYPHIQGFRTGTGTALTFAQVVEEAAERGARLLTIQELEAGVADGTGFAYNEEITWTSSPAGVGLVYGNLGSGAGTRVVLNTNTDTAAGGYAVSVIGQRQWTDTQYADKATTYTETEVDGLLDDKAAISGQAFSGNISAPNLIGTNTGDQDLSGKADKATTYTETEVDGLIATRTESPDETAITGTATFTNLTNNIALTGLGSIGLEIGDVVQVTGTANNDKLFTVEVITDDDNVVVNQAHAGGTTSKSLVNETVSATVTLVAKWYNAADSLGRGWVDVTIDRSQNVAYSTLINRGFIVIVSTEERRGTANFKVNGENVAYDNPESNVASSATIDVTAASTYEYTGTITLWSELR